MIDPNTIETIAAVAGIAGLGAVVIFVGLPARKKLGRLAPEPDTEVQGRAKLEGRFYEGNITDGAKPFDLGEEMVITIPRYFVPEKRATGEHLWRVWERGDGFVQPVNTSTRYTTRSTALRASRRMNAKAAALEAEAAGCALPDYDPKWARNLHPRFQIMGWPEPFSVETLVLDTHDGAVIERWENSRQALDHATRLNGGLAATR